MQEKADMHAPEFDSAQLRERAVPLFTRHGNGSASPCRAISKLERAYSAAMPPHCPVSTLKFPQDIGARQSEIRFFESGR